MQKYNSSITVCATCEYWSGDRATDTFGQCSMVRSAMDKATCRCSSSSWKNHDKQANSQCNKHTKWSELR